MGIQQNLMEHQFYVDKIKNNLIDVKERWIISPRSDHSFNYATGLTMTNKKFDN